MFSKGKACSCLPHLSHAASGSDLVDTDARNMAATSLVGICRRASAFLKAACSLVEPKGPAHSR